MSKSYFSISFSLIATEAPLPYDLYVNSSSIKESQHFVRILSRLSVLRKNELADFKKKYHQLYVSEDQRTEYFQSVCVRPGFSAVEKTTVLKEAAIYYLENLFSENKGLSTEMLANTIQGTREVAASMVDLIHNYKVDDLQELIGNLSFHDFYTYDHSINVSMYCILIFKFMNPKATRDQLIHAGLGGLLHDLGKIKIPTQILNKPDTLTPEEFEQIKQHPKFGYDFIHHVDAQQPKGIDIELLSRVIFEHHENFDGSGYPRQLKGDEIHPLAKITAIADFFDAVTTERSYHKPLSVPDALALMSRSVGKKLDPSIFKVFVQQTEKYEESLVAKGELLSDFDPCQPHSKLPMKMLGAFAPLDKLPMFGKIKPSKKT